MELRQATKAEIEERHRLTHAAWGTRLTLDQYLERERALADAPFASENLDSWVLSTEDEIFASCETYRMKSAVRADDQVQGGSTYGVASVFVEPQYRNKGYATDLLTVLLEKLKAEESAQASILFSEVGAGIYERVGYHSRPSSSRIYKPAATAGNGHVADVVATDAVEEVLGRLPAGVAIPAFQVVPTAAQVEWHVQRSRYYALALKRKEPEAAGAQAGDAWALWTPDYKNERLSILAMAPGLPDGTRAVLEEARRAAHGYEVSEVLVWENPDNADLNGGESVEREGSIPMIAPFFEDLKPDQWTDYSRALWV